MTVSHAFSRIVLALLLACTLALSPHAARANNIAAELVSEGPAAPGETAWLAIAMDPAEGWHGYWRNPGDAGFGMTLDWTLPSGARAGEPQFPVPTTLLFGGLMNHVYKGPFAVLVPVQLPPDATPGVRMPVRLAADWLACTDTVCVPEQAELSGTITVAAPGSAPQSDPRFVDWRGALASPVLAAGRYEIVRGKLRVAVPVAAEAALSGPHLFLGGDGLADYAAPQTFSRSGNWVVIETSAASGAQADAPTDAVLRLDAAGRGLEVTLEPGAVPAGGAAIVGPQAAEAGFWADGGLALILGALLGGMLLNVMPCVFPILSLKAMTLANAGQAGARRDALAYSAGVVLSVLVLGAALLGLRAAGQEVGWAFQLQEPATVLVLLLLAVAITANLAGLFEVALPARIGGHGGGAFLTGILAAVAATPCTGPFMAAAMGAALLLPVAAAMALFAALGIGLALPFLAIGFIPALRRMLPTPGPWMNRFRRLLAIPMGLTALALVWLAWRIGGPALLLLALAVAAGVVVLLWRAGRRQRSGHAAKRPALAAFALSAAAAIGAVLMAPNASVRASDDGTVAFSLAALSEARESGRPVFAYFTADWCVTCKVNESVAIETDATRAAFAAAGVIVVRGDWTRRDPQITRFLGEYGAAGVPFYVWFSPEQGATILPQILTPALLAERARAEKRP